MPPFFELEHTTEKPSAHLHSRELIEPVLGR
jgi:hypothetical protein